MSNKSNGTKFEKELCEKLAQIGAWCRLEYPAEDGSQPFDVECIYKNNIFVFECKNCENGIFDLNRVRENQILALKALDKNLMREQILFAFKDEKGKMHFVDSDVIFYEMEFGKKKKIDLNVKSYMDFECLADFMDREGMW